MKTRTIVVTPDEAGRPIVSLLKHHLRLTWSQAGKLVEQNRVRQGPRLCRDPQSRVRKGQKLRVRLHEEGDPDQKGKARSKGKKGDTAAAPKILVRYLDDQIIVVDKPPGLTTMRHKHEAAEFGARGKRFLPKTLADLLPPLLEARGQKDTQVTAVHRLDRDTSGLVVFARTPLAVRHLGGQFRSHSLERTYLALVRGKAKGGRIESNLVEDRGDGRRGSGEGKGNKAVTHMHVVEKLGDYTLVSCRLETGRTHQVRIHMGERGTPLCGEKVYDRPVHGQPVPDNSGAPRLCLHAATLEIDHPTKGKRMSWKSPLPADMAAVLKQLRRHADGGSQT